ncbi:MAG: hemerythrin family protein [Acidobacteria bacterium]|nr:hemerythrin family protein [Acidobacteriota bacterium]
MADLQWRPRYELGIPLIDEQHKRIFFLLSELMECVAGKRDRAQVSQVLANVMRQTREHFHTEETLMVQMGFPALEGHQEQHKKLMHGLHGLEVRFQEGDASMAMLVTTFLGGWLRHHINEGDRAYAEFLKAREAKSA